MDPGFSNDVVKIRMMAAQMRHHAMVANRSDYAQKFEQAAAELDRKAEEAERRARDGMLCGRPS